MPNKKHSLDTSQETTWDKKMKPILSLVKGGLAFAEELRKQKQTEQQRKEDSTIRDYERASDDWGAVLGAIMRGDASKSDVAKAAEKYDRACKALKDTSTFNREV
jgi:hypothetical protein